MKKQLLIWFCALFTGFVSATDKAPLTTALNVCKRCHGIDGNSIADLYPNHAKQKPNYIVKQLKEFKAAKMGGSGRVDPVMGAMALMLSEEKMQLLGEYFSSQTPKAKPPATNEKIAIAEPLYFAGNKQREIAACAGCHGVKGDGSNLSKFAKISSQNVTYLKNQLNKFKQKQRDNDLNEMMRDVTKNLSATDIDALAQYLNALK